MADFIAGALFWASFLSGYPLPAEAPKVINQPHMFFVQKECKGKESHKHPCDYVGAFLFQNETVHIDERLEDNQYKQILVHEMVHYLQNKNHKWFGEHITCKDRIAREREAYAVEQRFINEIQHLKNKVPNLSDDEICED